jgi:hypothetical protein
LYFFLQLEQYHSLFLVALTDHRDRLVHFFDAFLIKEDLIIFFLDSFLVVTKTLKDSLSVKFIHFLNPVLFLRSDCVVHGLSLIKKYFSHGEPIIFRCVQLISEFDGSFFKVVLVPLSLLTKGCHSVVDAGFELFALKGSLSS